MTKMMVRVTWLALLLSAGCNTSGGNSQGNGSCRPYCNDLCAERAKCPNPPAQATCVSECLGQAQAGLCEQAAQNLDDESCMSLATAPSCQSYCSTLCSKVQTCGSVDEATCRAGCMESSFRLICDEALITARQCPDLLAEANCHLLSGRGDGESHTVVGGSVRKLTCENALQRGTCEGNSDCRQDQACNLKTNLCGACSDEVACGEPYDGAGSLACIQGKCELVECASNDDCPSFDGACDDSFCGVCDSSTNSCVECLSDGDCSNGVCDTDSKACVECMKDGDCAQNLYDKLCDSKTMECTSCDPARCDGACDSLFGCVECKDDRDCKAGWDCFRGFCEVPIASCASTADCVVGAKCSANGALPDGTCYECLANTDCNAEETCSSGRCVSCLDDGDCTGGKTCLVGHCTGV